MHEHVCMNRMVAGRRAVMPLCSSCTAGFHRALFDTGSGSYASATSKTSRHPCCIYASLPCHTRTLRVAASGPSCRRLALPSPVLTCCRPTASANSCSSARWRAVRLAGKVTCEDPQAQHTQCWSQVNRTGLGELHAQRQLASCCCKFVDKGDVRVYLMS